MGIWDDHDAWIEQLREFIGPDYESFDDETLMFTSNLALQMKKGEISFSEAMTEVRKWVAAKMGFSAEHDDEVFRLELEVNYPDFVEVTARVQANLRFVDEPGLADGIVEVWADPRFAEFTAEHSGVAFKHKAWLAIERMTTGEHATLGWAIAQAMQERNADN